MHRRRSWMAVIAVMRVVLLGPPGAGKGTQAQRIAEWLHLPAISTGEIFRRNVRDRTELGRRAQAYVDAGDLVPDQLTFAMVKDRLAQPDAREGFVLDGFPRTVTQAEALSSLLADQGTRLDCALELVADEETLVRRLSARRVLVDGQWVQREDDKPEQVRHRLAIYQQETLPVCNYYQSKGLLVRVDATGTVEKVTDRVVAALQAVRAPKSADSES